MAVYTLNKNEKLKSRKSIESLFRSGNSIFSPPFRLLFREVEYLPYPAQMTVAIPKRLIKHAVDRNLLKRRTREVYRLKKPNVYKEIKEKERFYEILFLYQAAEVKDFNTIRKSMNFLLIKFLEINRKS